MNWEHQELARRMFGEWALNIDDIPSVVRSFRNYLGEHNPHLLETLDETSATDYFAKVLSYGHFVK